jgi:biofilm PGA synthesis N-glycosyltransferase PgaC
MLASLFTVSIAGIALTYFGYPALITAWAFLARKPVLRAACTPQVVILVVAYNEAARIAAKIGTCLEQHYPVERLRVLVVSDGSSDETVEVIRGLNDPRIQVLGFATRRGKAACLNDAMESCDDEVVVFSDARQLLHHDAVRQLVANFADDDVGAVSGELSFLDPAGGGFSQGVDAYWRYEKFIRQQESLAGSVVGVTGALYALRRSLWQPIPPHTILDDVMIPMNVVMQGKRVLFEKGALAWDRPSTSANQERLRKVRTLAGNFQLLALRPEFLLPWRNPLFLQFLGHKVLRLLVPAFMALALASNIALAFDSKAWAIALIAQLLCYAIAVAGALVPALCRWLPVKMLTTFALLNVFVVLGLIDFVFDRNAHLWRSHDKPVNSS